MKMANLSVTPHFKREPRSNVLPAKLSGDWREKFENPTPS